MTMRIVFLGNNWVGWQTLRWLKQQGEDIAALVIHPPAIRRYGDEIIASATIDPERAFDGAQLERTEVIEAIRALEPDIAVSAFFGFILRPPFLDLFPAGCINLHPSLLPYNRGAHPNVWSIVDGTPAGATLHYIDSGVDTGDIIAQRAVEVEAIDTGATLYRRLERACVDLFAETWPLIRAGRASRTPQRKFAGTCHRARDLQRIDEIDLDATYRAKDLIDRIRARTFAPYPGVFFRSGGRKVYLHLDLSYEEQPKGN